MAEYVSGLRETADGTLAFTGLNHDRLLSLQRLLADARDSGKESPIFPLEELTTFTAFRDAWVWASRNLGTTIGDGVELLYDQAWALTYFLNEAEDGRYRQGYLRFYEGALSSVLPEGSSTEALRAALGVKTDEEFASIEAAYRDFLLNDLSSRESPGR